MMKRQYKNEFVELTPEDMERVYDLISLHKHGGFSFF